MSATTSQALHEAIQAHLSDEAEDDLTLTNWVVTIKAMNLSGDQDHETWIQFFVPERQSIDTSMGLIHTTSIMLDHVYTEH